jgi:hypothetical protein
MLKQFHHVRYSSLNVLCLSGAFHETYKVTGASVKGVELSSLLVSFKGLVLGNQLYSKMHLFF